MNASLRPLIEEIDYLVAERKDLRVRGPRFKIVHRFRVPGTDCLAGEEIGAVFLVDRGREYSLRLPLALRILFDYMARNGRFPQSARQIELGLRADEFYRRHAANAGDGRALTRRIPRSAIKVYIKRLHAAIAVALRAARSQLSPDRVLVSHKTVGNEVGYQLKARSEWLHLDLALRNHEPLRGHGRR
jgi:hypothetical protein